MENRREVHRAVVHREDALRPGDRRKAPRASCEFLVEFYDPGSGQNLKGTVLDISKSGMRVKTMGAVHLHDPENLKFFLWINGSMLKVSGAVVRRPGQDQLGISFRTRSELIKDRLADHVEDAASKNTRIDMVKQTYEIPTQRDKPTASDHAKGYMRSGMTMHDGLANAKAEQRFGSGKWISRRIASHY